MIFTTREGAAHVTALRERAPTSAAPASHSNDPAMRLADAIGRVEPTWVEAVAVVQAVCAQLAPGHAPPGLGAIMISPSGTVSFSPDGMAEADAAVKAVARLLSVILRQGDCPLPVWEAIELAAHSPMKFGSPRAFGESLNVLAPDQAHKDLAAYFQMARQLAKSSARPSAAAFGLQGVSRRALMVVVAVALSGVGTGMSVAAVVATRTAKPLTGLAAGGVTSLLAANAVIPSR